MEAPADLRQSVVFAARFEFFAQRFEGVKPLANAARVREYWADVMPPGTAPHDYPKEWCGGFCLFCIHRAELGLHVFWRGGFAAKYLRQLAPGELPKPGDVAYFTRYQHHAIVEAVNADAGTFDSIDGNQNPGILRHAGRKLAAAYCFYSIAPLIEAKEAANGAQV